MSVIVGITDGKNITMGCDSYISGDNEKFELSESKIIKKNNILIGVSGTMRGLQLLKYQLNLTTQEHLSEIEDITISDEEYICNFLVNTIKEIFFNNQYTIKVDDQENHCDNYLIGYKGKLYTLDSNYQIYSTNDNYMTIGSGSQYAYGALKVQEKAKILLKDPEEAVIRTISVVSKFCPSVGGEIKIFNC